MIKIPRRRTRRQAAPVASALAIFRGLGLTPKLTAPATKGERAGNNLRPRMLDGKGNDSKPTAQG